MSLVQEDKNINNRRIFEEVRKKRIFNAKQRQIGLDLETLNHQVHENRLTKMKEVDCERKYTEDTRKFSQLALHLEHQQRNLIQEQCKKIDEFRLSIQRPENRRDFDLYDPNLKKKERPPRMSDGDDCPVSGIQRLDGEDLNYKGRLQKQKDQVQDNLLQQMQEKQDLRHHIRTKDWKSMVPLQKQENNIQQKHHDETDNRKAMEFNFYGDMLRENPSDARSTLGPGHILPNRWKGMCKTQLDEYYRDQCQQIIENQRKKDQEHYEKIAWNKYLLDQQNTSHYLENREKMHKLQLLKILQTENQQLAQEQKQQQDYLNKVVFSNIPTKDFFDQFNTSSR